MTDSEAQAWLEDHRAELETIVLTNRMIEEFVPGSTLALMALSNVGVDPRVSVHHGAAALEKFAEWSASK